MQQQSPCITTKNLELLQDQMQHEANVCKKYDAYSQQITDPQLKNHVSALSQHHKQHFDTLFTYLNNHK